MTRRIAGAAALAVSMLTAFAALGGVGLAQNATSPGQHQYGKVAVCHKGKTITISRNALPAHQRHGDAAAACASAAAHKGKDHKARAHGSHERADAKAAKAKAEKTKADEKKPDHGDNPGKGKGKGK